MRFAYKFENQELELNSCPSENCGEYGKPYDLTNSPAAPLSLAGQKSNTNSTSSTKPK